MNSLTKLFVALGVWCVSLGAISAPKVVVTIAPVHSLVAAVMQNVADPELLFPAARTPHGVGLKPSQVRTLVEADLAILVDPQFERSVIKAVQRNQGDGRATGVITLSEVQGIHLLSGRNIALDIKRVTDNHTHGHHDHPAEGELDPHLWLSTENASAIVSAVATHLMRLDPSNAATYQSNAQSLQDELNSMRSTISSLLQDLQGNWLFFHDAYQYFEQEFNLTPMATVTVDPERQVSGKRLRNLAHLVETGELSCIYIEPQLRSNLVDRLVEETEIRVLTIDPLGSGLKPGPRLWFELMNNLADRLAACNESKRA
ncbi:MAG: zinc ABC transporter substrate-binding protein [Granulosicoccus sp.]|nr:zinc ABC transporter substrate-binding protein [Granulosicoccus sp.]